MAFLAQKLIYKINIWFNFVPHFFGQDHLLNVIISGQTDAAQNLIDDFFSNFGCQKTLP